MGTLGKMTHVKSLLQKLKPRLPQRLKGGRIEKITNYFYRIYEDYKVATIETVQDMKDNRSKSAVYLSIIGTVIGMIKTNPTEENYRACLVESVIDIGQVGSMIRNQECAEKIADLKESYEGGTLKFTNLLVCTLVRKEPYPKYMDLYQVKCKHVRTPWTRFHENVIDVGVFSRWINLERTMKDYDVNPDEWTEDGLPKQKHC